MAGHLNLPPGCVEASAPFSAVSFLVNSSHAHRLDIHGHLEAILKLRQTITNDEESSDIRGLLTTLRCELAALVSMTASLVEEYSRAPRARRVPPPITYRTGSRAIVGSHPPAADGSL